MSAIADQQHLRVSIIEAIEKGDYSKIDTELFLKGYVRAYAKQVGLNGDAIIRDLDIELEPRRKERERQQEADPLVDIERRKRRKRRVAKTVMAMVALVALAVGISSYLSDGQNVLPFGLQGTTTEETTSPDPAIQTDADGEALEGADGAPLNSPEPMEAVGAGEPQATPVAPEDPAVNLEVEPEGANDEEVPASPELVGDNNSAEVAEAEKAAADPVSGEQVAETATETETEAVPESAELVMTFNGDCWVQISDAQGNQLASTLQREGDELRLDGTAPLNVIVGAMTAVESIRFRGEAVDLDNIRTVNNRAQFTLEP
ncbi:MAG: DUF4115 domain-containing protein [Alteromonadaceae bacterium]|nr:DUF4115 domain-containing protein [Alteromonadaceae bacterium]